MLLKPDHHRARAFRFCKSNHMKFFFQPGNIHVRQYYVFTGVDAALQNLSDRSQVTSHVHGGAIGHGRYGDGDQGKVA